MVYVTTFNVYPARYVCLINVVGRTCALIFYVLPLYLLTYIQAIVKYDAAPLRMCDVIEPAVCVTSMSDKSIVPAVQYVLNESSSSVSVPGPQSIAPCTNNRHSVMPSILGLVRDMISAEVGRCDR